MGQCMKDHPLTDVKEKLDDARSLMDENLSGLLDQKLNSIHWEQKSLNELFHALKKLEKFRSEGERTEAIQEIKSIVENQS